MGKMTIQFEVGRGKKEVKQVGLKTEDIKNDLEENGSDVQDLVKKQKEKKKTEMQLLKEEAKELDLEFAGNISKEDLKKLINEAKSKNTEDTK